MEKAMSALVVLEMITLLAGVVSMYLWSFYPERFSFWTGFLFWVLSMFFGTLCIVMCDNEKNKEKRERTKKLGASWYD